MFLRLCVALGFVLALAFGALAAWVATGPRSLNALSPYITEALTPAGSPYQIRIGETWLVWGNFKHPLDIRLRNVSLYTKEGQQFSAFPEIAVGIHLWALAWGEILPTSVAVSQPVLSLYQNEDRTITFGFRKEETETDSAVTVPFEALLEPFFAGEGNLRKLRRLTITDANIRIGSSRAGMFFEAWPVDIVIKRSRQGIRLLTNAKIRYEEYQSALNINFLYSREQSAIEGEVEFAGLAPGALAAVFADKPFLNSMSMPISGNATVTLDQNMALQRARFSVTAGSGTIVTERLAEPLAVEWLHAEGQISNKANDIQIDTLTSNINGVLLEADGVVLLKEEDASVQGFVKVRNVEAEKLRLFWPPELAPMTREWVVENITRGHVPVAQATLNIQFGDLARPALPKEAVEAIIPIEDATVRYLPEHPPVTQLKGTIQIDGVSLNAAIESASFLKETKLRDGRVIIDDLNADNPYIKVNFLADAPAKEIVKFLGLPRLGHAKRLNLSEDTAEGSVSGKAAVGFYFFSTNPDDPDIDYDVVSEVRDLAQPGFMKRFDIRNATGSLRVNNKEIEFQGSGEANGATASEARVKYLMAPESGLDTFIDITAVAPVESLPRFGYPAFEFLKGAIGVKASLKLGERIEFAKASLDLTHTDIHMTDIAWIKPAKEAAGLDIATEKKDGAVAITSFHLQGKSLDAKGTGALSKNLDAIQKLSMDKYVIGKTNLRRFDYEKTETGYIIAAEGESADISGQRSEEGTFSFEHFPSMNLKVDVNRLILGEGQEVADVKGELNCDVRICKNANITGMAGKPFSFRILRNPKGQRQMSLHAEDAGTFLKAFNVIDSMEGGDLTITGNYDDSGKNSALHGRLDINEHVIKNAPILTKVLSLASLTGFLDVLQGNGIRFTKLSGLFNIQNDVITIAKGKAYGPSIGITAEGTITMPKATLDIKGTVVPAYSLNTVFGKIPILGKMLTGGEGQGVFAASYSVTGTEKDSDVKVNPLSILTPGFLRGLFDIMDAPSEEKKEEQE